MATDPNLWQFISADDYKAPQQPASKAVRSNLEDFWERLVRRAQQKPSQEAAEADLDLRSAPGRLLRWIAPEPAWGELAKAALTEALSDWQEQEPQEAGVRAFISFHPDHLPVALARWAEENGLCHIQPPSIQEILSGDLAWLEQWKEDSQCFVFPYLEKSFLRHENGLSLVRHLLDLLWERQSAVVLACDTWAWSYLSHIFAIDAQFASPSVLKPLQGDGLKRWFRELATQSQPVPVQIRASDSGAIILSMKEDEESDEKEESSRQDSSFFAALAARSRGIPPIAWSIWRYSLRIGADAEIEDSAKESALEDALEDKETIWVQGWDQLNLPDVPFQAGSEEAFVLHALLLHNGLSPQILSQILPLSGTGTLATVRRLEDHKLIFRAGDELRIPSLAYPEVRRFLNEEGFAPDVL